jgi:hypothetical protein
MDPERAALEELTSRLWDERQVVLYLLYRLTVSRQLLAADDRRFVRDALREVDGAVELLRDGELQRETALRRLAALWQVDHEQLSLPGLARRSPPPFDHLFQEHLTAFTALAAEIEQIAGENRLLAVDGLRHLTGTIDLLAGIERPLPSTYDATGRLDTTSAVGGHLRKAL